MNPIDLTSQQLRQAADIQDKIQSLQDELNAILGAPAQAVTRVAPEAPQKRKISAAGRAAIAAAQKARWAKVKGGKVSAQPAQKPKRKLSPAALANIRAGVAKRMARAGRTAPATKLAQKPKRKISAAGKARLSALAKARWAKARAQGKARL